MLPKIKEQHHAGRTASGVSQLDIEYHHNQWCRDNGYGTIDRDWETPDAVRQA